MFQRRSLLFVRLPEENLECAILMFRSHSITLLHLFCFVFLIAKMLVVNLLREEEYVSISNRDYDNLIVLLKVFITISIVKSALLVIEKPNRLYSMHV